MRRESAEKLVRTKTRSAWAEGNTPAQETAREHAALVQSGKLRPGVRVPGPDKDHRGITVDVYLEAIR